jgi:hypothetical protein
MNLYYKAFSCSTSQKSVNFFEHFRCQLPVDTETQSTQVFASVPSGNSDKSVFGRGFPQDIQDSISRTALAPVTLHIVNSIISHDAAGPAHMTGLSHTAVTNQLFNGFRSILLRFQPDTPGNESAGTGPDFRTLYRCCQCVRPYLLKKYR